MALDEATEALDRAQVDLDLQGDHALPLENLDANCVAADALFVDWPPVDVVIGNPPYRSKNKMQAEYGREYLNRLRKRYPDVPGRADYCVYWFRRTHDELRPETRAGLVGTNTIRQNYSREGGLDYIVASGGTITDAIATQVWSGDAAVHVSIVNWVKGADRGPKTLRRQNGDAVDSPWESVTVDTINAALSFGTDVTMAQSLASSAAAGGCYQGQTHGHEGFLVSRDEAEQLLVQEPHFAEVLFPFLTTDELLGRPDALPNRYVIDFGDRDLLSSQAYRALFERVRDSVLVDRQRAADLEAERSATAREANANARVNRHHANFLSTWWRLSYRRGELMNRLAGLPRYIVCGRITKRPIFEFVNPAIHPNDALTVFPFSDDYSFGILQSVVHWDWFVARCSTLKGDFRYTSNSVFDSFPWPQRPGDSQIADIAEAAVALRAVRAALRTTHGLTLRDLYRGLEQPGTHPLKSRSARVGSCVRTAYGFADGADVLAGLLALNAEVAAAERAGGPVTGPGLPSTAKRAYTTDDCLRMP